MTSIVTVSVSALVAVVQLPLFCSALLSNSVETKRVKIMIFAVNRQVFCALFSVFNLW